MVKRLLRWYVRDLFEVRTWEEFKELVGMHILLPLMFVMFYIMYVVLWAITPAHMW